MSVVDGRLLDSGGRIKYAVVDKSLSASHPPLDTWRQCSSTYEFTANQVGEVMKEVIRRLKVMVTPGFADTEYYVMVPDGPGAYVSRDLVSVMEAPRAGREVAGQIEVYV